MEKRRNSRVSFGMEGTLTAAGRVMAGEVENISLKGVLFKTARAVPPGSAVRVQIDLAGSDAPVRLDLGGKVVHACGQSLGIQFFQMDLDSFTHLRNLVCCNHGDPEAIMAEFAEEIVE